MTADLSLTAFPIVALRPMMDREQPKSVSNPDKSRTTRRGLKVRKKSRRVKTVDPSLTVFSNVDPSLTLDWERPQSVPNSSVSRRRKTGTAHVLSRVGQEIIGEEA